MKITRALLDYLGGHTHTCRHSNASELGTHLALPRRSMKRLPEEQREAIGYIFPNVDRPATLHT